MTQVFLCFVSILGGKGVVDRVFKPTGSEERAHLDDGSDSFERPLSFVPLKKRASPHGRKGVLVDISFDGETFSFLPCHGAERVVWTS
jgi:hypothetical protein